MTDTQLSTDFDFNYEAFVAQAIGTGCVWALQTPEGWALCPSVLYQERDVMPFWSQPEYAQIHCRDEWRDYQPVAIAVEELLDDWCPGLHDDLLLMGLNWNDELEGHEIEPLDVAEDIEASLSEHR